MKFVLRVFMAVAAFLVLLVILGSLMSNEYEVSRSIQIKASPERIHVFVGDLAQWDSWTTWLDEDPTLKILRSPKTRGIGAMQRWEGESGEGMLTFTEWDPTKGVAYDLAFGRGRGKCKSRLDYEVDGDVTRVTWRMFGKVDMPIVGGVMAGAMDGMAGPMFEDALANLKEIVEGFKQDAVVPSNSESVRGGPSAASEELDGAVEPPSGPGGE